MYLLLFNLAGFAIVAWLLLIFLPKWRVTRFIARTEVFPVLISVLYVVGVVPLLMASGPGVMRDFGSAEGVTRLLAKPDAALIAWIHILAFDQLVGLYIYRENMAHGYLPLPVQSVLLFLTLMFGPVGFLAFYVLRRARGRRVAGEPGETSHGSGSGGTGGFGDSSVPLLKPEGQAAPAHVNPVSFNSAGAFLRTTLRDERALVWTGVAGLLLGVAGFLTMAVRGRIVAPEGDLFKCSTFDIALGIYVLTIMLLLPLAGFSSRARRSWRWWLAASAIYGYAIENIQIHRGLDPRFSRHGSGLDQLAGLTFLFVALGLIATFIVLAWRFFSSRNTLGGTLLLTSIRYACIATLIAFFAGLWMSAIQGSRVGAGGNLLPLHAAGFHGMQALPLVALLLAWADVRTQMARLLVHVAGTSWLVACLGIAWQTRAGRPVLEPSPATVLALAAFLVWALCAARAAYEWRRAGLTGGAVRAEAAA